MTAGLVVSDVPDLAAVPLAELPGLNPDVLDAALRRVTPDAWRALVPGAIFQSAI